MKFIKNIIFGALMGTIISGGLLLIARFPSVSVLMASFLFAMFFLLSFYFYVKKTRSWKEPLASLTPLLLLSQIGLVSIIEHYWIRLFVIVFSGLIFGILYGAGVTHGDTLSTLQKPYRRFVMAAWVFTIYGISTSIFALQLFLPNLALFLCLLLGGGFLMGFVASFVWKMYHPYPRKVFLLWMILVGFVGIEFLYALHFLPLGYLTLGLFTTWFWYILVLLARFHWDENGIEWKKQLPFLLTNLILFVMLVVFFVRWI